jgi:hypothetical protein
VARQRQRRVGRTVLRCRVPVDAPMDAPFPMPEVDENGVDRSQIRALLRLTPVERLRQAEQFLEQTMQLWEQNGIRPLR